MIEFTEREKKIILIKYIVHGVSPYADAPLETRIEMFKAALGLLGYEYDEKSLIALGDSIIELQGKFVETFGKFVKENTDIVKKSHIELHKGNESLEGILGKDFVDEGLKLLDKGKV